MLEPGIQASTVDELPDLIRQFAVEHDAALTSYDMHLDYGYWGSGTQPQGLETAQKIAASDG